MATYLTLAQLADELCHRPDRARPGQDPQVLADYIRATVELGEYPTTDSHAVPDDLADVLRNRAEQTALDQQRRALHELVATAQSIARGQLQATGLRVCPRMTG